jgi:hypothetical protein
MENKKVEKSTDLNTFLAAALSEIKEGNMDLNTAKSIALVADKINKNNLNAIQYKKITSHRKKLDFFE